MKTPDNLEVFATHGSHTAPDDLEGIVRPEFDERLRLNYSDFATWDLLEQIPEDQKLRPKHGRIAGDPNRSPDAKDLFRDNVDPKVNPLGVSQDFNNIQILTTGRLSDQQKLALLETSHIPYHREATSRLFKPHGNKDNRLVAFDVHDTGNLLPNEKPEEDETRLVKKGFNFPPIVLGNLEGKSAPNAMMDDLASAFETHFNLRPEDIRKNDPYKGGYFTQKYGNPDNPDLKNAANQNRAVIQVELGRYMYVDEKTQAVIKSAMEHFQVKIAKVFSEVAYGHSHKEV